jgi:chemotaxis protein methyltransferase CheR
VPLLFDSGPRIKPEEFRLLRDFVNDFCGIRFPDDMQFTMERKLRERLQSLEINDFAEYYHYLRYHPDARAEIERAVDVLTTNETYLFREEYQLRAFQQEVLPLLHERGRKQRRLSIWSAGCSTGEEVYTLAILIRESRLFEGWDVRVIGNDISRRVLQVARRATYGNSSFRSMPQNYQEYFVESPEGRTVRADIRAMCNFAHLNLLDAARYSVIGTVDAVQRGSGLHKEIAIRPAVDFGDKLLAPVGCTPKLFFPAPVVVRVGGDDVGVLVPAAQELEVRRRGRAQDQEPATSGMKSYSPMPCRTRKLAELSPAFVTRCGRRGATA